MRKSNAINLKLVIFFPLFLMSCSERKESTHLQKSIETPSVPSPVVAVGGSDEKASVDSRVREIIADQFGIDPEAINLNDALTKQVGTDELGIHNMVRTIEKEFLISIPHEAIADPEKLGLAYRETLCGQDFILIIQNATRKQK